MYPKLFDLIYTYGLCIGIGILLCLYVFHTFANKKRLDKKFIDFVEYLAIFAIGFGIFFAAVFQGIYNWIATGKFDLKDMTFIGGLIGGVAVFLAIYFWKGRKYNSSIMDMINIVPCCITIAHGFGRIGCFFAGCCYGIETDSIFGITFPGHSHAVYPTQLFEALFLLSLFGILTFLFWKYNFKHTMEIYLIAYGIFRFLIEFIRGDDRGSFIPGLTPSQFWAIVMVILGIAIWFLFDWFYKKHPNKGNIKEEEQILAEEEIGEKIETNN